jgi:DNA-binding NarL/FixJ family response regulator
VGYLVKNASRDEIIGAVRQAAAGASLWSRDHLRRASQAAPMLRGGADPDGALTKRENEVLKQLALGLSNKEIAQALDISYETVKEHVQHILRKLGVADRTQAAVWAVRKGLA